MTHHAFGAAVVHSALSLPSLPRLPDDAPGLPITVELAASGIPDDTPWQHHWLDGDEALLSLARQGEGYWLRVPGQADFLVHLDPCRVQAWPTREPPPDAATLEHLLVDQILPRVLAQLGGTLIHASAVRIGARQVLFAAPSGWGKSTLAGLLHRAGHPVLSDDCVQLQLDPVGRVRALATYPSLRLNTDSLQALFPDQADTAPVAHYTDKRRVPVPAPADAGQPTPVDAIYLLGDPAQDGDDVRIEPAHPAAICLALIRHSFRLDLGDRAASAAQLRQCGAIASAVPGFELHYPRDHARSDALLEALFAHLATLPPASPSALVAPFAATPTTTSTPR